MGVLHDLRSRIMTVRSKVHDRPRPRVLAIEWLDPPFAPGHWVPEMIELAGGENLLGTTGARSREVDWAEIAGLEADVLIVMPCGYGLEASLAEADRFCDRLAGLAPRAFAVDGSSYFNRSGPRVVDGIEILAGLLHPDLPDPPPAAAAPIPFLESR
jgi:iron complex transport system substrate-binding protein